MQKWWGIVVMATCVLCACAKLVGPAERKPEQAGQALDPVKVATQMAATQAAAITGDQQAVQASMYALNEDFRKSIKLADPARRVDREAARVAAKRVDGVRSVAWVDQTNLLAIVSRNDARSYQTIDAICLELEPLGDTLGVVVNLQSGAALTGDDLAILSRNCQLAPGDRALLQRVRQLDSVDPTLRTQHRANNPDTNPTELAEWKRKNADSMRILEENERRQAAAEAGQ
jgi:hypothetical protein